MTARLMLLDTASLYFRAFFGVPDSFRALDGTPVNAIRGLLDFIATLVTTHRPQGIVACWDQDWRPGWRVELLPSYKAHRVAAVTAGGVDVEETPGALDVQVPLIRAVLDALDVSVAGAPAAEADDVIGTLCARASGPVDVVTGDRDLFQLVDDASGVRVLYTARGVGRLEVVTDAVVVAKYGILPEQYADFATLRGDPSDGLPGVKGVGERTAATLLREYGDLAGVLAAAADPASSLSAGLRARLLAASAYLAVAERVVRVARDLPLPDLQTTVSPTPDQLAAAAELGDRLSLAGALQRAQTALRTLAANPQDPTSASP
ncbi:MAG TPA: 5'-3' exonuclease [Nocardioidaceae bacterium]|nr:5'-3' exonuclease [Nocardioidaceae bacterium]